MLSTTIAATPDECVAEMLHVRGGATGAINIAAYREVLELYEQGGTHMEVRTWGMGGV